MREPRPGGLQRVLAAVEHSEGAVWTAARAAQLPFGPGASLDLLHVVAPTGGRSEPDLDAAARWLEDLAEQARNNAKAAGNPGLPVRARTVVGHPAPEIVRHARSLDIDLIAVGRERKPAMSGPPFGSTRSRVLRKGDLPMLVVTRPPQGPYRRAVAGVDLSDVSGRVVELALRLLAREPELLSLAHAYHVSFEIWMDGEELEQQIRQRAEDRIRRLRDALKHDAGSWHTCVRKGDAENVLLSESEREHADLIALGTHGRSGLPKALVGSVAETVASQSTCDVVIARPARHTFDLP